MPLSSSLSQYISVDLQAKIKQFSEIEDSLVQKGIQYSVYHLSAGERPSLDSYSPSLVTSDVSLLSTHEQKQHLLVLSAEIQYGLANTLEIAFGEKNKAKILEILRSEHCTLQMLSWKDPQGQSFFHKLYTYKDDFLDEALKDSSSKVLFSENFKDSILFKSIEAQAYGLLVEILNSPGCSEDIFKVKDDRGRNALMFAFDQGLFHFVHLILECPSCTSSVLDIRDEEGQSILSRVCKNESNESCELLEYLIQSGKCSQELLESI